MFLLRFSKNVMVRSSEGACANALETSLFSRINRVEFGGLERKGRRIYEKGSLGHDRFRSSGVFIIC